MVTVHIRPIRLEDAESVNEIRRQPSVMLGTLGLPSERVTSSRSFIEGLRPEDHLMVADVDGKVVGVAGLHVQKGKRRHSGSIGLMIHEDYQGQGVGRALMNSLLDLADNYLGLIRIDLDVLEDNSRAIRLYESLGFTLEGRKRQDTYRDGQYLDSLIMGRLR